MSLESLTMDRIHKNARQEGECLVWTGWASQGKYPQIKLGDKVMNVRRALYIKKHGPLRKGMQVGVKEGCCELCVEPEHLVARTKAVAQKGRVMKVESIIRFMKTRRATSKLTPEIVAAIRASDETGKVLDERYGLGQGYAAKIKTGEKWKDYTSPFAGLVR